MKHNEEQAAAGATSGLTERRQTEAALRESQERYVLTERAVNDGFWDWNILTGEDQFSARWKDILGYREGELPNLKTTFLNLLHPEDRALVDEATRGHLEEGKRYAVEFRLRHKDGSYRWVFSRGEAARDAAGRAVRMFGAITDITERKQAEEALAQANSLLNATLESTADGILVVDRHGKVASFNRKFLDMWRIPPALAAARDDQQLLEYVLAQLSEPEAFLARVKELYHNPQANSWDELKFRDGRFFERYSQPQCIGDQIAGRVWSFRDITARKQAEAALTDSELRFRTILEQAPMAVSISRNGIGLYANQEYQKLFGLQRAEEWFGREVADFIAPPYREESKERSRRRSQGLPAPSEIESVGLRTDGTQFPMHITVGSVHLPDGEANIAFISDITGRRAVEEQMRLQFSALTAAANAILITDRKGKIEWVNPAFTKLTGYSAAEAVGANPRLLKSGRHPPEFYAHLWATILAGNVWHGEIINQRKDGGLCTEDMTITPVRDAGGQVAHFVAIKQDITERRQIENRLQQAQKMEAIGTLAGGIAHDFNNILAAMFGYAYLLQQDVAGNADALENLREILNAAGRAKDLVQQILTFSRQREQKRQVVRLNTVVKEAVKFVRASLPAGIKIELQLDQDSPPVLADPSQIYQIVLNLATNAFHAMEGTNGTLTVGLNAFVPPEAFLKLHPELPPGQYARLTVADTGQGMDARTLEHIFEPFFTTKPVGKGTGLGLSVVHGIVQSHAGSITVESAVGQGTTFNLYFPAQAGETVLPTAAADAIAHGHGQKILLVDDEPALTTAIQRLLTRLEYVVTVCNHPHDALRILAAEPARFDLLITDLNMPDMNGLDLARQIHVLRPDLPVLLATGFNAALSDEKIAGCGIRAVIEKPVAGAALAEAVRQALAGNSDAH